MLRRFVVSWKPTSRHLMFVPKHNPPNENDYLKLKDFFRNNKRISLLTGAGISTESGIPDYRSEEVGLYARTNHKPIQYQEFIKSSKSRQRYWARNFVGWSRFSKVHPNATHYAISDLEKAGKVTSVITQNVDRLHQKAGSKNVIELHGSAYLVKCLHCDYNISREDLQEKMIAENPSMKSTLTMIRPDGDVDLPQDQVENFKTPHCSKCEGPLKPDIVFFGDNVPKSRVDKVRTEISYSDALFVIGSTLTVYSSYRIVLQAKEENKDIAILNIGPTRADNLVKLKVSAKCGAILPQIRDSILQ
ncbi:NAD-dependent protein deacylase Sirt4 [Eumeta japonica]|uniref:NAD-dependent protein deacylase n=1 Tax=Eumeta variegata TaxID=151549 RepID=A0A4C1Y1I6_EUMVA|nr:NAD-dependent protein deacylase Sirt4 [Eumeta japonica]